MNIIQSQKIGLCVAGTKSRQGGFTPFVIAGILAGDEAGSMDRVTLVAEKPAYIIKHTPEYILYLLIDRKVKPCDRDTYGVLSIALTIARDMRLADGKSPYALLKEVYDKFRSDYMEPYMEPDGTDCDRFINKDMNPADFASIMEQYPVEKHSWDKYVAMNPSGLAGTLCVPQDKMEDLFRDSQYPEFANFKEIEIGTCCQTTIGLENIEIPRPVVYSIELNGKPIKSTTVSRPEDKFDTASVLHNTTDVEYENMSFSLGNLLEASEHRIESESGNSSVVLDKERKLIVCTIEETPITYSLDYEIRKGTKEQQEQLVDWISNGKLKLTFEGNPVDFPSASSLLNPKRTYILASLAHKKVNYRAYDLDLTFQLGVQATVDDKEKHVTVTFTITPFTTAGPESTYSLEYEIQGGEKEQRKQLVDWISDGTLNFTFGTNLADFSSNPKQASIPFSWLKKNIGYQIQNQELTFGLSLGSIIDKEKKRVKVVIKISKNRDTTPVTVTGGDSNSNQENNQDDPQPDKKKSSNKAKKIAILMGVCFLLGMCLGGGIVGGVWHFWGAKKLTVKDSTQTAEGQGLTYDDFMQIAKEKIRAVPFDQIISIDEALKLETLRPLREAIEAKLRLQIENKNKVQKQAEEKEAQKAEYRKKRQEILKLVNKRDWDSCKNKLRSWIDEGYITEQESNAITAVLYVEIQNKQYENINPQALRKFKQETIQNENFESLDDVVRFNKDSIMKFIKIPENQKRN